MRTIKFRAWENDTFFTFPLIAGEDIFLDPTRVTCIEQFTGLLDKNGKEIYEGDIVNGSMTYGEPTTERVTWDHTGFQPFRIYDSDCQNYYETGACEVIGNIHENPDLLP